MLTQQLRPNLNVPVFDLGEPPVKIRLLCIGLGSGQQSLQVGSVGLILPMMLEDVEVRRTVIDRGDGRLGGGHERKGKPLAVPVLAP